MKKRSVVTIDGNTAAAHVAYAFSEVAAIYPITPASSMGELVDEWASHDRKNIFGEKLHVIEMQSEAGASGAVHGSLSAGALTTTFTASQGLLLMLPNMFKIAGEMMPTVFHIATRSLAYQSLSIFCDHSDVMATRGTGFAMMAASNVQEVADNAIVAHLATLESRVPFLAFFDGFRTSHEIQKVELLGYEEMGEMMDMKLVEQFRARALSPDHPYVKVGAENPDVYFQGREASNKYYEAVPGIVKKYMKLLGEKTGRKYAPFEYTGSKYANKLIVIMGSGADTVGETAKWMNQQGERVGMLKVRLFRPFSIKDFMDAIPKTVRKIAVLDRTKEAGSAGEPLYLDVVNAFKGQPVKIIGGRYGLSSKELTPSMVKAVYKHLDQLGDGHDFTVGITDDVTHKSIIVDEEIDIEPTVYRAMFWGLGSDGTVGANKNTIKIIGEHTDLEVQAYFSYDSKKSGGITRSYLRFGKDKIRAPYIFPKANLIAVHNTSFIGKYDLLEGIKEGGILLLNSGWSKERVFSHLTEDLQKIIIEKNVHVYNVDASRIAKEVGLGRRINTVMQAAFFKISGVLPEKKAISLIKDYIKKTFEKKGMEIVKMNWAAVDRTNDIEEVPVPKKMSLGIKDQMSAPERRLKGNSPFANKIIQPISQLKGDTIPVSSMTLDGSVPSGTTKLEKRGISSHVPKWVSEHCIQCGLCSFVCPHAAIRIKQMEVKNLKTAPKSFNYVEAQTNKMVDGKDLAFTVQVYPEDCTGCNLCVDICPTKEKSLVMHPIEKARSDGGNENVLFFEQLPDNIVDGVVPGTLKFTQLHTPLFEFSGACSGCGETPYIKLLTQLYGERLIIANATGCSSIFGGTFPTIPYTKNKDGRGPAWANSLFEDNAEYSFGMRMAVNANREALLNNVNKLIEYNITPKLTKLLKSAVKNWSDTSHEALALQDAIKKELVKVKSKVKKDQKVAYNRVLELADYFVDKAVWAVGGDGWAYDIGFGGLDHVLAMGKKVKILVLDTEVYSNTGGQASKATPMGAVAKFAAAGKELPKKNLAEMMMTYGHVYVAQVDLGANKNQLIKAMIEAEEYDGPAIVIAYAICIAHGVNMSQGGHLEKEAVDSGYWPLFRYDPRKPVGERFKFDSPDPKIPFEEYIMDEKRYAMLKNIFPQRAKELYAKAEATAKARFKKLKETK